MQSSQRLFDKAINEGVDVISMSVGYDIPLFSYNDQHDSVAIGSFYTISKVSSLYIFTRNDGFISHSCSLLLEPQQLAEPFQQPLHLEIIRLFRIVSWKSLCNISSRENHTNIMLRKIRNTEIGTAAVSVMQAGGVGLIFLQSGDNRLDPCVLVFLVTNFPIAKLRFPQSVKGNFYSCPPVARIAALIKSAHLDWSPDAIRSALVTSSESKLNLRRVLHSYSQREQHCSTWVDMSHLPGKQPPLWRTQAQPKYQEEGNSDKKGDKCGTNTNSVYKAVVKAPYSLKMRVEPSSFEIQHNHPSESFPSKSPSS
ncbi:hypothetical protein EZV62_006010 [Acer yangbiense]|uniref:Peptidase S8/S53 domain-containing protein n=1 Tax=Acer yangbiense TaxID=1000413 RepID=A0A5C7IPD0_9ROSI|nr:hypothetical protein EZV62_006010 [Acer yangbiense]